MDHACLSIETSTSPGVVPEAERGGRWPGALKLLETHLALLFGQWSQAKCSFYTSSPLFAPTRSKATFFLESHRAMGG